jgi:hypothetical protein
MNMIESEAEGQKPNQKYLEQLTKVGSDISVALEDEENAKQGASVSVA